MAERDARLRRGAATHRQLGGKPEQPRQRTLVTEYAPARAKVLLLQADSPRPHRVLDSHAKALGHGYADVHDRLADLHALHEAHSRRQQPKLLAIQVAQGLDRRLERLFVARENAQPDMCGAQHELVALPQQRSRLVREAELEARIQALRGLFDRHLEIHVMAPPRWTQRAPRGFFRRREYAA